MALQLSALRFAMRTTSPRMIWGPWPNKELHDKYTKLGYTDSHKKEDGSHDYQYAYMRKDIGPSVAPWVQYPTATRPHPYREHPDPHEYEMYPRKDATFFGYFGEMWAINRNCQSRADRMAANYATYMMIFLALYLASLGAHGSHEDHTRDWVMDLPRRH